MVTVRACTVASRNQDGTRLIRAQIVGHVRSNGVPMVKQQGWQCWRAGVVAGGAFDPRGMAVMGTLDLSIQGWYIDPSEVRNG